MKAPDLSHCIQTLIKNQERYHGEAGRRWLDQLARHRQRDYRALAAQPGAALPQRLRGLRGARAAAPTASAAVLKLCFIDAEFLSGEAALRAYDGRAAVRLLDADVSKGALLLERLEPGQSLSALE